MKASKIWLSSPHMGGTEQKYVTKAFEENWIAPLGPNVTGFENDLEHYLGRDSQVACVSSGTGAIHIALDMAGVSAGDTVLCQSFTFCGSANPITYLGAKPIFIDSELETWNMSPEYLKAAIEKEIQKSKKPKAVLAVHLYGMPAKIDQIEQICKEYDIVLIEDAAEALGSEYKGRKCGTFGDFSILSFNGNKIITTSGGGALVCRTKEAKAEAIFLATQARDNAPHYQHSRIGYNYRMSNVVAGIGRGQMEVLEDHVSARRANHTFYKKIFEKVEEVTLFEEPSTDFYSNHWLSCITFDDKKMLNCEKLRNFLLDFNIESRPLWKPMHLQPVYESNDYYGNGEAAALFNKGLCLPSGSNLGSEEKNRIKEALYSFFENN
ncbi:DegT/DnrJ/EryC1/StrS family aminotransferase [Luteirhabdus pelagi]|uniref:DegT/DnrJ/EryC1/StrS family aminotransferase n=1 Tax=Luteirhabdus pelagi TaxID=2792783 RepID=UPI00193A42F8|nr:aminotransferase class I/II-fold pyridoxal phosphate-dependent enzyme [Luteirhabdus pelagi]